MSENIENQEEILAQNKKRLMGSPCGYEAFDEKLRALGGDIRKVDTDKK